MKPEVTLTNVSDGRRRAWEFSRPGTNNSTIDMNEIGAMDLPVNSLCTLTFEITSSILFRDWLLCIRPIQCWARSSRATPLCLDNMSISDEFGAEGDKRIYRVIEDIGNGVPQDKARENIPLSMSVSYTVRMDLRTCIGMLKTMLDMSSEMYEVYGVKFWDECRDIEGFMDSKVKSFENTYMPNELDRSVKGVCQVGSMVMGRYVMKEAFAAQFIRSNHAKVKFELWWELKIMGYQNMGGLTQAEPFDMTFYIDSNAYRNMMKSRAHWLADWSHDMWGSMVGDYIDHMDSATFWEFIEGEDDPYASDMKNRIECTDPGLPSPITLQMPSILKDRLEELGNNAIIFKYGCLVDDGYIIDNPDNELRKQYESIRSK